MHAENPHPESRGLALSLTHKAESHIVEIRNRKFLSFSPIRPPGDTALFWRGGSLGGRSHPVAAVIRSPNFMITVGLISSFFGGLTFALLLWFLNAGPDQVRIGWFTESAISASLIIPVILKKISYWRIR